MKKLLVVSAVALGFVSTSVFAENFTENYQTSKHNIRIICDRGNCIYQSWNKPKQIGHGKPDLELRNGSFSDEVRCYAGASNFTRGNLTIVIGYGLEKTNRQCLENSLPPKNVYGDLDIYQQSQKKSLLVI